MHEERNKSFELDMILGQKFDVLDDGFVRVVDYMGNDASICQAARCSYGKGTKSINDDESLIRYLLRHRHTSPVEQCELKLHVRVPMDCWRQWIRHRTANVNEYSTRYSEAIDSMQSAQNGWRLQSKDNKQGSLGVASFEDSMILSEEEKKLQRYAREVYNNRLKMGIAREQARKDLPLSTYTEAYWKVDLHNLLHFLGLRMEANAQKEIREYATVIGEQIVSKWVPVTYKAWKDYQFNAIVLTTRDQEVLNAIYTNGKKAAIEIAKSYNWFTEKGLNPKSRERIEFEEKIKKIGITNPWN